MACLVSTRRILFTVLATSGLAAEAATPEILITGAPDALAQNIEAHLGISDEECEQSSDRMTQLLRRYQRNIRAAGQALGYYRLTFEKKLSYQNDCWRLTIDVSPGEPLSVGRVHVTLVGDALSDSTFTRYLKKLPVKPGDQLHHGRYEQIKSDLTGLAVAHGYFDAYFAATELKVDTAANTADITIDYRTGRRYTFGEVKFTPSVLSPTQLQRYVPFHTGQSFAAKYLLELQRALNSSRYFTRVTLRPRPGAAADGQVPIDVSLTPRKQYAWSFGVGVATDTGPRGRISYENRYVNSRGDRLTYDLSVAPVQWGAKVGYRIPGAKPASEYWDVNVGFAHEDTDSSESDIWTLGVEYTDTRANGWLRSRFVTFRREDFVVGSDAGRTDLLMPGISWSHTVAKDLIYPLRGWRVQARLRGAYEGPVSDATFLQAYLQGKVIRPLGSGRLLARLELGATAVDDLQELPSSVRFFAGGDSSVRGYDYESLGSLDENGEVVGGTHLVVGSLEYDFRVKPDWALAVFFDLGSAFDEQVDFKRSAGVGLRWLSPIGPVRMDMARALDDGKGWRLHLRMGPDL